MQQILVSIALLQGHFSASAGCLVNTAKGTHSQHKAPTDSTGRGMKNMFLPRRRWQAEFASFSVMLARRLPKNLVEMTELWDSSLAGVAGFAANLGSQCVFQKHLPFRVATHIFDIGAKLATEPFPCGGFPRRPALG